MKVLARYAVSEGNRVRCRLCPNYCLIAPGRLGRCFGKKNIDGKLYAVNYGEVVSMAVDPVEKKPLYHFHPGAGILSVATYGCNLLCPFCQNSEISQRVAPSRFIAPERLVELAKEAGVFGVAFTYTEPLIWFEYLMDACPMLHKAGFKNVLVTNGMINPEPLNELLPFIDAMNIDLKSIRPEFYTDYVKGDLETVLNTIRTANKACHTEITCLLIPGRNDSDEEIRRAADFVAGLGQDTVLHFSRYFPHYRATEPPTSKEILLKAANIAKEKLHYVYLGNIFADPKYRDSFCPDCGQKLVDRSQYSGLVTGIKDGKCVNCGRPVDFVI